MTPESKPQSLVLADRLEELGMGKVQFLYPSRRDDVVVRECAQVIRELQEQKEYLEWSVLWLSLYSGMKPTSIDHWRDLKKGGKA